MASALSLLYDSGGDQFATDRYATDSDETRYGVNALLADTYAVDDVDVYSLLDGGDTYTVTEYDGQSSYNSSSSDGYSTFLKLSTPYKGSYTPEYPV